jgi:hypothetical protein
VQLHYINDNSVQYIRVEIELIEVSTFEDIDGDHIELRERRSSLEEVVLFKW